LNDDASEQLLGTTLADTYILESQLGEGGMGRVYLARHTRIDAKRFAVKVLHEEFAQHTEALARFKREAEATALISSPHVIGVHDVGTTPDGRPFIASDFLEGEELADRLEREGGQLPVPEAVRIVREVCAGLAAAHAQGVIHRDIKPENVFLVGPREANTVKILDFGISRLTDQNAKALTQAGIALGTPDFMSPEQARGKPVDHRADIYATGILLYLMVTGVSPFERESPQETLMALLTEEVPTPTTFEPNIPPQLVGIIEKAIAKEADQRYQTVQELLDALAAFDPTAPQAAPAPPEPTAPIEVPPQPGTVSPTLPDTPAASSPEPAPHAVLGVVVTFLALWLGVGGLLRAVDVDLGIGGWLIIAVLLGVAVAVPSVLLWMHLSSAMKTDRGPKLARALRSGVLIGITGYAIGSMLVKVLQIVLLDDADNVAWGIYDLLLFFATAAAAAGAAATELKRPD
jgi:serine/threonine-protein kinase